MTAARRSILALGLSALLFALLPQPPTGVRNLGTRPGPPGQRADASQPGDSSALDYLLTGVLVVTDGISTVTALGTGLNDKFQSVAEKVSTGGIAPPPPQGGTTEYDTLLAPAGATSVSHDVSGSFDDGASLHSVETESADFANGVFDFGEQASIVNATTAVDAPNVKLLHERTITLSLLAPDPGGQPPGAMASLRMDFSFGQLDWGIGGPVPQQDGIFEIEGPGGVVWGWSMEKNPATGLLEITSTNGPSPNDFTFDRSGATVTIEGVDFQPEEVLRSVSPGPSFDFQIPYGVATDVTFKTRRYSHTVVPDPVSAPALAWGAQVALASLLALLGVWQAVRAQRGLRESGG